jgi:hypothetical protein
MIMKKKADSTTTGAVIALIIAAFLIGFFALGGGKVFAEQFNRLKVILPWFNNSMTVEPIEIINYNKGTNVLGYYDGMSWRSVRSEQIILDKKLIKTQEGKNSFYNHWFTNTREPTPLKSCFRENNPDYYYDCYEILDLYTLSTEGSSYLGGYVTIRYYYYLQDQNGQPTKELVPGMYVLTSDNYLLKRNPKRIDTEKVGSLNEETTSSGSLVRRFAISMSSLPEWIPSETKAHLEAINTKSLQEISASSRLQKPQSYSVSNTNYRLNLISQDSVGVLSWTTDYLWYRLYDASTPTDIYVQARYNDDKITFLVEIVKETYPVPSVSAYDKISELTSQEEEILAAAICWRNSVLSKPMQFTYYDIKGANPTSNSYCVKDIGPSLMIRLDEPVETGECEIPQCSLTKPAPTEIPPYEPAPENPSQNRYFSMIKGTAEEVSNDLVTLIQITDFTTGVKIVEDTSLYLKTSSRPDTSYDIIIEMPDAPDLLVGSVSSETGLMSTTPDAAPSAQLKKFLAALNGKTTANLANKEISAPASEECKITSEKTEIQIQDFGTSIRVWSSVKGSLGCLSQIQNFRLYKEDQTTGKITVRRTNPVAFKNENGEIISKTFFDFIKGTPGNFYVESYCGENAECSPEKVTSDKFTIRQMKYYEGVTTEFDPYIGVFILSNLASDSDYYTHILVMKRTKQICQEPFIGQNPDKCNPEIGSVDSNNNLQIDLTKVTDETAKPHAAYLNGKSYQKLLDGEIDYFP